MEQDASHAHMTVLKISMAKHLFASPPLTASVFTNTIMMVIATMGGNLFCY